MTHIVGSGANNTTDRLFFKTASTASGISVLTGVLDGAGRAYVTSLMPGTDTGDGYGETVSTTVYCTKTNPYDCLSWAAIVFSTPVKDDDGDGLPDKLEGSLLRRQGGRFSPYGLGILTFQTLDVDSKVATHGNRGVVQKAKLLVCVTQLSPKIYWQFAPSQKGLLVALDGDSIEVD